jgi:ABC-type transport system involved in cytochrome bd biosynthesis fused ATPase/permease subunit
LQCLKGQLFVQRNVAYVPQQAWILNDTIRRNVVFGCPYDPERYQRTIAACALVTDISQIDGGHDAEIVCFLHRFLCMLFLLYLDCLN